MRDGSREEGRGGEGSWMGEKREREGREEERRGRGGEGRRGGGKRVV